MDNVAFVVDSSASINDELRSKPNVYELQMTIALKDGTLLEDTTDEQKLKDFYKFLDEGSEIPTTSQPALQEYISTMENVIEDGYETVIFILVSSKFSGTYSTAESIAEEFKDRLNIHLVDSKGTSYMIESVLIQGLNMLEAGEKTEKIVEKLQWVSDRSTAYFVVEDLNFFVKGGRLNALTAFIGSKLKIIPMIHFTEDGEVKILEVNRTIKRAYSRLYEFAQKEVDKYKEVDIIIAHADVKEKALEIYEHLKEKLPDVHYRIGFLTPTLGTHGGRGAHGIGIIPKII